MFKLSRLAFVTVVSIILVQFEPATASSESFASPCPDLGGQYTCEYKGYVVSVNVEEKRFSNHSSYTVSHIMGSLTFIADGKNHFIPEVPGFKKAKNFNYQANCHGKMVQFAGTGEMTNGSGRATMHGDLTQTAQGVQINSTIVTPKKTYNDRFRCTR